ncbi:hypothetical protein SAMN04487894_103186 [Niabella drilacis]|uniref:Uncharacterized protein n=1 Tax=Niabella drilacis (strain DSM 25811 / CCM 8410 / CCUG 62505 / LMG 26954 / E90) TaxID=1285928 RepID=A0A1G6N886_NIADE|nr:hypothetical protein SAMN04487894_103186 [Niabella drilacis]
MDTGFRGILFYIKGDVPVLKIAFFSRYAKLQNSVVIPGSFYKMLPRKLGNVKNFDVLNFNNQLRLPLKKKICDLKILFRFQK